MSLLGVDIGTVFWAAQTASTRLLVLIGTLGTAAVVFLVISLVLGNQRVEHDLETRLSAYTAATAETGVLTRVRLLRRFVVRAERLAERRGVLSQLQSALEQANLKLRPGEAIAGALVLAAVAGLIGLVLSGNPIVGALFAVATAVLLSSVVAVIASRQRRRFEEQLPDTLNLLATSLRAGYSMLQSLEAVAQEAPDPTAREFRRIINEVRLGRSAAEALQDSARRMESVDFDWVVLAFTIQREVGGNLAEVLQTTSETILHRGRLRREMRALTAEGRISAIVLGAMPFVLFLIIYLQNPDYLAPLLSSIVGVAALMVSGILLIAGLVWIARIVKIEL